MTRIGRKARIARRHGAADVARALARKAVRLPLLLAFGADRWHLRGYHTTAYMKAAVAFARDVPLELDVVAEVGCGLGEILTRVPARRRLGYDIDRGVIASARFLQRFTRSAAEFTVGSFEELAGAEPEVIDLLVVTGWFHYMPDDWIKDRLRDLLAAKRVRYILVDEFPHQRGRIEPLMDLFGVQVERRRDWQDDKSLFLYRCDA
ncbi:class I SAM-dependent methyltransferase [Sphaerisporangium sp. TRM90804]|uniref:class I SAM-dependent methyltransferase n=1 Tax=Sphaerisporangium sp. TRM90804 TaxID=3031113 RepID=UPI00244C4003|nr:class I SAM-dependent methyltransferase [Sphaerisporangium sp. TRM90804]MDH2424131.1 class I SAM-dependent methyltransferase [Sphaerisporangium sp. TRM90804]